MAASILVIDHDPDIRYNLRDILHDRGFRVFCAADTNEAMDCLKRQRLDLVLMDIKLPGCDGVEFIRQLKRLYEELEIIVLTGAPTIVNVIQALRGNGAFDLLTKPLNHIRPLIRSIDEALAKQRQIRAKNRCLQALNLTPQPSAIGAKL